MSLTRRLILSFAAILLLSLLSIVTHLWGNQVRSEKFDELQAVLRDQNAVREFGQSLDVMHKKMRVIQTLHQAEDEMPISEDEAREQIIAIRGMRTRYELLQKRLQSSLGGGNLAGVDRLLQYWRRYLQQLGLGPAEEGSSMELLGVAPEFGAVMQSLVERELALVRRAADINKSLNQAVVTTNRIVLGTFLFSLLFTIVLAFHIVNFTRRSISILHRGTEQWGSGKLEYQVPPLHGELGQLAESFNHMARNLRTAMNEVKAASARADAANQAKSSFLANMSHELRTPMNAIIGYSEMMIEEAGDDPSTTVAEFVPDLEKVLSAGQHLLALINDVLDISKIESGKMTVYNEDVDLDRLMDEILVTVQPLVDKNGNKLVYTNSLRKQRIATDVTRFRQISLNLLSNAAKFTRDGAINVTLRDVQVDGTDFIEVAVRDTGIGMSPEQIDQVFEAFIQADLSTTKEYGGTGLGLTISKKFALLLGGDIAVESDLGRGSCFIFRLPRLLPSSERKEVPITHRASQCSSARVLVVDDNEAAREISLRVLEQAGFEVVLASSGSEAIDLATQQLPDVVILDVMMPEMDGWQVLESLRSTEATCEIPVIIQSMVNERDMGDMMSVDGYLLKPVDKVRLLAAVRAVLLRCAESNKTPA